MRVFMNKNCLYLLTGCAMFLCAGACGRKAYALDYPNVETLEKHWNEALYFEMFEELYQEAKKLPLLSDNLPKDRQTPSFKMYFNCKENPFKTAFDLNQLPCDVCLRKICKVLCSSEFLEAALLKETVNALREGDGVTTIEIKASNHDPFFDQYGKGRLEMTIERNTQYSDKRFRAWFVFAFEKVEERVWIQATRSKCKLPSGKIGECFIAKKFPMSLPNFPYDDLLKAPEKIADAWTSLSSNSAIIEGIPFCNVSVEWKKSPSAFDEATSKKLFIVRSKLKSREFLEGIFGKSVLDIFKYECSANIYTPGLWMGYIITPLYKKQPADEHVDELDIRLWITNPYEDLGSDKILKGGPDRLHDRCLNTISDLHFTLDIVGNKVYNANFLGNLKLNGCTFMEDGYYNDARPVGEKDTMIDD